VDIETYNPLDHARLVYELWQANMGETAPLAERMFHQYTAGRLSYDEGDGIIAICDGKVVGFGMIEVDRLSTDISGWCSITALFVDRGYRRRGIGRAIFAELESRSRELGFSEVQAGGNYHTLWPAIPLEPPGIVEFFEHCGFKLGPESFDLLIPLIDWETSLRTRQTIKDFDIQIESLTSELVGATLEFEEREFPYWVQGLLKLFPADMDNVIIVRKDAEVIGSALTFIPTSRFCAGGMQRDAQFDGKLGAVGAVGMSG